MLAIDNAVLTVLQFWSAVARRPFRFTEKKRGPSGWSTVLLPRVRAGALNESGASRPRRGPERRPRAMAASGRVGRRTQGRPAAARAANGRRRRRRRHAVGRAQRYGGGSGGGQSAVLHRSSGWRQDRGIRRCVRMGGRSSGLRGGAIRVSVRKSAAASGGWGKGSQGSQGEQCCSEREGPAVAKCLRPALRRPRGVATVLIDQVKSS
jgi:hypothetical protein